MRIFVLLKRSSLRAADRAVCQSFTTRFLRQPESVFPLGFSLSSAGDDVEVDAIHDSMSDFPIAREVESLETSLANFDGDSLSDWDRRGAKGKEVGCRAYAEDACAKARFP